MTIYWYSFPIPVWDIEVGEQFLACVEECFEQLKEYIQNHIFIETETSSLKECLSQYYKTRMIFFHENPLYQKIFCEAVIMPPAHLKSEITHRRKALENMNIQILEQFLSKISLRDRFQQSEVAKLFVQFLNFMDLQSRTTENHVLDLQEYEQRGQVIMDIFLFGVVKKETI